VLFLVFALDMSDLHDSAQQEGDFLLSPIIDWVWISQAHASAPEFGGNVLAEFSRADGAEVYRTLKGASVSHAFARNEASSSRFVSFRSSGGKVSLSFNPSKVRSYDGLDGCRSMAEAIDVCNWILREAPELRGLDFPAFSSQGEDSAQRLFRREQVRRGAMSQSVQDCGATLSRVDINRVFEAGSASDLHFFMRGASSHAVRAGAPRVFGDFESLVWGSKRRKVTLYCKGVELASQHDPLLQDCADWGTSCGLVRHEVRLQRRELVKLGIQFPHAWSETTMSEILENRAPFDSAVVKQSDDDVFSVLVARGLHRSRAATAQSVLLAWQRGHQTRAMFADSTWRRAKSDLLSVGWDIRVPAPVAALSVPGRTIVLRPAVLPARFRRREFA